MKSSCPQHGLKSACSNVRRPLTKLYRCLSTDHPAVKDVHKDPALDLVGWWSTAPSTGPNTAHLPLHRQILRNNEAAVFLAFHPSQVQASDSHGAKLPLTVYESVHEGETAPDASKDMQVDGEEPALNIRFRELSFSVETGESEMIGIDTIVQASGTASLNVTQEPATRAKKSEADKQSSQTELSQEEEERKFPCLDIGAVAEHH
jgi:COP9 signalosome complex subunit 6